jgi:CRP-like cAMP-binding protein
LDILYSGCTIGSYSSLTAEDYSISGFAKTDLTVLKLDYHKLDKMRDKYEELDDKMTEYENY